MREHYFSRRLRVEPLEDRRMLAVLTVNTHSDDWNTTVGDEFLTLREAITVVNAGTKTGIIPVLGRELSEAEKNLVNTSVEDLGQNDLIVFSGVTSPIQLANGAGGFGQLNIQKSVVIDGQDGSDAIIIQAWDSDVGTPIDNNSSNDGDGGRIFEISGGGEIIIDVELRNLTLTGADVRFGSGGGGGGGAIRLLSENLILDNVLLHGNASDDSQGGGAIYASMTSGAKLKIANSILSENYATWIGGGGAVAVVFPGSGGEVEITNSIIKGNYSYRNGGGIVLTGSGAFSMTNCLVANNQGSFQDFDHGFASGIGDGGGINVNGLADFLISQSQIQGNSSRLNGGGLSISGVSTGSRRILDTTFAGNITGIGATSPTVGGGGIHLEISGNVVEIVNSTISNNRALSGGGIFVRGNLTVRHSTIVDNVAGPFTAESYSGGGGIMIYSVLDSAFLDGEQAFDHCIIAYNQHLRNQFDPLVPLEPDLEEDGDDQENYSPDIGAVFIQNPKIYMPGRWYNDRDPELFIPPDPFDVVKFNYSIITDLTGPFEVEDIVGIVTDVPTGSLSILETNPLLGELQDNGGFLLPDGSRILTHALLNGSPAINAGDPGFSGDPEFDQRGFPFDRVYGGRIDIGAYEKQPIQFGFCDADFDRDGDMDGRDFLIWQRGFGIADPSHQDGDANFNGIVDGTDLACWQAHYGTGTAPLTDGASTSNMSLETSTSKAEDVPGSDWYKLNGLALTYFSERGSDVEVSEQELFNSNSHSAYSAADLIAIMYEQNIDELDFKSKRQLWSEQVHGWNDFEIGAVEAVFAELL
jgi:hypothetical protein